MMLSVTSSSTRNSNAKVDGDAVDTATLSSFSLPEDDSGEPSTLAFPSLNSLESELGEPITTVLHRTCQLFSQDADVVENAIHSYPKATRQRAVIPVLASQISLRSLINNERSGSGSLYEPYTLPLNISLIHNASVSVLELLVSAGGQDLLLQKDGAAGLTPLAVALQQCPARKEVIELLVEANPKALSVATDYTEQNLPLHLACLQGASLEVIQYLARANPLALNIRNSKGQTPLDIVTSRPALFAASGSYGSTVLFLKLFSANSSSSKSLSS